MLKCCVQPRSFDHFHFVLVKLTVSKFCLEETLIPKLNEMFASADYQAAVGFVFGCRRKATPICNSDQAAVGFGFGCRRKATPICNSDQAAVGFVFGVLRSLFGCRRRATPICNSDQAAVGFGFKCRREATGKSAADEGNEPFRHPSKSFCALDVE